MINTKALWLTGMSGAGKTTIAKAVKNIMIENGYPVKMLDGDEVRKGLNKNLGFSLEDRFENIRRAAEVNNLFLDYGINTINAFISPTNTIRGMARTIIGPERFFEICLTTPIEVCVKRDPKGFYKKISNGSIQNFTGIDSAFEFSNSASLYLDTSQQSLTECAEKVFSLFEQQREITGKSCQSFF